MPIRNRASAPSGLQRRDQQDRTSSAKPDVGLVRSAQRHRRRGLATMIPDRLQADEGEEQADAAGPQPPRPGGGKGQRPAGSPR